MDRTADSAMWTPFLKFSIYYINIEIEEEFKSLNRTYFECKSSSKPIIKQSSRKSSI